MNRIQGIALWLVNQPWAHRGAWVLIQSVWEIAAVAAALALILWVSRRTSPQVRYLEAIVAMVLMLVLPAMTFALDVRVGGQADGLPGRSPRTHTEATIQNSLSAPPRDARNSESLEIQPNSGWRLVGESWKAFDRFLHFMRRWAFSEQFASAMPWLTVAWGAGVLSFSLWNLGGWMATHRLRTLGLSPVEPALDARLGKLCRRLGLAGPVRIAISSLVGIPVVIGNLRPLVLIPGAVLLGLSPLQLDAILAHELAHIRRRDYLVNLLQVLVETLIFYHPAVWWVSHCIRIERENCCDDIAAETCGNHRLYAESLLAVEQLRPPWGRLALAATSGGTLLGRIQRLVGAAEASRRPRASSLAAVVISLSILVAPLIRGESPAGDTVQGTPKAAPSELPVSVDSPMRVSGQVTYSSGVPVTGIYVTVDGLKSGARRYANITGINGRFALSVPLGVGWGSGKTLRLVASKDPDENVVLGTSSDMAGQAGASVEVAIGLGPEPILRSILAGAGALATESLDKREFSHAVAFVPHIPKWGHFHEGDAITITSVRSDRAHIELGGTYLVEGVYTLQSEERASLSISETALTGTTPGARSPSFPGQRAEIARGSGRFELLQTMRYPGSFHISIYPTRRANSNRYESSGSVYFAEPMKVVVDAKGSISIDERSVADDQLNAVLNRHRNPATEIPVLIRANETGAIRRLAFVMDCLRTAGYDQVIVQPY